MITTEMLSQQAELSGLTDEQKNAIVTLSKNDEDAVMANRFRDVYNQMDETIKTATGIERNGDEKTYNYLKRAASALAEKANSVDALNTTIQSLTAERDRLQEAINKGAADAETKQQLAEAKANLESITTKFNKLKADYDTMGANHAAELLNYRIDNEIASAKGALKFKAELPEQVTNAILSQVVAKIKGLNKELVDDGNGGKKLQFKEANGAVMMNPENKLNPYTIAELLTKELKAMGVLDEGRKQEGIETKVPHVLTTENGGLVFDLSAVRTQTEAQELIAQALMKQGLTNGSKAFQEAMNKAWADNNISKLPMK